METAVHVETIRRYYREAFDYYDKDRSIPFIGVEFYPYVNINHTIRVREGSVYIRIAELCHDMPAEAHRALAYILVAKLYRRRAPKRARDVYANYIKSDQIRERSTRSKRERGRKVVSGPEGEIYDLEEIFEDLNTKYFGGQLAKPVLTWSARRTYRILGHHDATHETVVISRSLDTDDTPRYVVEYIVFHEMLHIKHPTVHHNGRRYNHTSAFRRDEEQFRYFHKAESWIEKNVRKLKRRARKT
jgi:predicted metal-dependent hydrolase